MYSFPHLLGPAARNERDFVGVAVETVIPRDDAPHPGLEPRSLAPEPGGRRAGLRVQLVVALGVLAVVGFVPLYLAVASLTTHTLRQNREEAARALGRAVAGRLAADVAAGTPDDRLRDVATVSLDLARLRPTGVGSADDADASSGGEGVVAIRIARPPPAPAIEVGHPATLAALRALPSHESGEHVDRTSVDGFGPIVAVDVATTSGDRTSDVQVALRVGDQASRAAPLLRLVAFYTASFAVVMIVLAYLLLTRVMVRPVRRVVQATRDVDAGVIRRIDPRVGRGGAEEVAELGRAIARTTARLVDREETLAAKVRQLEAARADLLAARDAIVRSERLASVGRLAAGLAHEVGNPIAALLGLEEVVLGGDLDEETRDLVARMKRETERVHRVLRDLLDFARAEQDPTSRESLDATSSVSEVVEEVAALVKPQKSMRDIELEIAIEDDLPPVRIAAARLQQILLNLLLNAGDAIQAVHAKPDAEGLLGRITIHATRGDDPAFVRVEVSDDGPGVPDAVRDVLFEPFVTTKEVGKGTGLGLAVCRGLVEGIGGSIRLADTPAGERGAWFVVELPTPSAPPPKRSVAPPPPKS